MRVLLVEDNPADVELELLTLRKNGFEVSSDVVQTAEEFTSRIRTANYDLILADYNLPQWRGTEALDILCRENLDIPVIVVTGYLGEEKAVDYIKQGATDCVLKDHLARLPVSVRRAQEEKRLRDQRRQAEQELAQKAVELARSNAELEQFAYVASHDLQEPLRMIANYTQLLAERYRGKLDEQADKYIALLGGWRGAHAGSDSRPAEVFPGRQSRKLNAKTTDCHAVVEQAMKNLQAAIQESGAVVNWNATCPWSWPTPSQLTQVFQNLIANAIKFHGSETPVIHIDCREAETTSGCSRFPTTASASRSRTGKTFSSSSGVCTLAPNMQAMGSAYRSAKKSSNGTVERLWIEAQAQPRMLFQIHPAPGTSSHRRARKHRHESDRGLAGGRQSRGH